MTATPLPVTGRGIEAHVSEGRWVHVDWTDGSELDNDHFTVERSIDAITFEASGDVPSLGDTETPRHYAFRDEQPFPGLSYYRVKQVDIDGAWSLSSTVSVEVPAQFSQVLVVPNPLVGDGLLSFVALTSGPAEINVHDARGLLVRSMTVACTEGPNTVRLDLAALANGLYALSLGSPGEHELVRFIKDR